MAPSTTYSPHRPTQRALPAAAYLAAFLACLGLGLWGLTQPPQPEARCRIEVYADGSAEPLCQPGYQPTRPIDQWPIIRVEA